MKIVRDDNMKEEIVYGVFNMPMFVAIMVVFAVAIIICFIITKRHNLYVKDEKVLSGYTAKYKENGETI